jgi:DNA-binding transcriptional ArsR family regulator
VLANLARLQLFAALVRQQPQTVSSLAEQTGLSLPMASMSLRAMESRGLLVVRRVRRQVQYRIPMDAGESIATELAKAIKTMTKLGAEPAVVIFRAATGFTHPARVEIYRRLAGAPMNDVQLAVAARISHVAGMRHLRKLESRGYIAWRNDRYEVVPHPGEVQQIFVTLALRDENITLQKV